MATSSILTNIKITDPKKVEDFVEALDISAHEPERIPSKPIIPLVTNIGEIRKFMGMENREKSCAAFFVKVLERFCRGGQRKGGRCLS